MNATYTIRRNGITYPAGAAAELVVYHGKLMDDWATIGGTVRLSPEVITYPGQGYGVAWRDRNETIRVAFFLADHQAH